MQNDEEVARARYRALKLVRHDVKVGPVRDPARELANLMRSVQVRDNWRSVLVRNRVEPAVLRRHVASQVAPLSAGALVFSSAVESFERLAA